MKLKNILLTAGLVICALSIIFILTKGRPQDKVSFDSLAQLGESIVHHADKSVLSFVEISDAEEMRIGQKMHQRIIGAGGYCQELTDPKLAAYVTAVGTQLLDNVKRADIKYTFHLIDTGCANAFSSAGGHIYITKGLLDSLKSEAELAFILGHEIIHVDAKHCINSIQYRLAAEKANGAVMDYCVDIGYQTFLRPAYSEFQEDEADSGGLFLTYKAGYHPASAVIAFEHIDDYDLNAELAVNPVDDTVKAAGGFFGRYFDTHPSVIDRVVKLEKQIADAKLVGKFYLGLRNYKEKVPRSSKAYRAEFRSVIIKEKPKEIMSKDPRA